MKTKPAIKLTQDGDGRAAPIEADAVDAVSIKVWKMGGLYRSRDIASVCSAAQIKIHVGSTAGSQLLEAMQRHFCASLRDLFGNAEIGEFESLTNDPALWTCG